MLSRRKSIFFGSIFEKQNNERSVCEEPIVYKEKLS
jgi:hypothetical protein